MTESCAARILPVYPLGRAFECRIGRAMAGFRPRADRPCNGTFTARLGRRIVGGISIDGEDLGGGIARLHWSAMAAAWRRTGGRCSAGRSPMPKRRAPPKCFRGR